MYISLLRRQRLFLWEAVIDKAWIMGLSLTKRQRSRPLVWHYHVMRTYLPTLCLKASAYVHIVRTMACLPHRWQSTVNTAGRGVAEIRASSHVAGQMVGRLEPQETERLCCSRSIQQQTARWENMGRLAGLRRCQEANMSWCCSNKIEGRHVTSSVT